MLDVQICEAGMKSVSLPPPSPQEIMYSNSSWGKCENLIIEMFL